ncbi:hypothetical protein ACE1B6_07115 [Aerosakkonemataceae cyanobacterium BLCC-F154]|uniref:Glycosyltransferase RgtA/B/C/D-like domain-containing protein n=1 Tax=Floridaenema fluviatile BLCC-F154 TaxID=3153640 RepID=A0ABV4Y941_9CYAN
MMNKITKRPEIWYFTGFILTIIPAFFMGMLIYQNSVNMPYWDDWEISLFLDKIYPEYKLPLQKWLAQANETRYLFPRFIFVGLAYLNKWNWDIRYQMWVSLALACLVSINVFRLTKWTIGESLLQVISIAILCNSLIFAPIQYENWLWGIQLIVFMPIACITTCLVVIYSNINRTTKLILCLILCTISTFSYANGMLSWVIVFPALAISKSWRWQDIFKEKWLYIPWIATFTANMAVYFYNYQKPSQTPGLSAGLLNPIESTRYFLSFLGTPLAWGINSFDWQADVIRNNIIIGTILISLFGLALFYLLKHINESILIYRMSGWFVIGFYTVISGIITSLGRVGFGIGTSIAPRYMTFSVYLPLALVGLIAVMFDDAKNRGYLGKKKKIITQVIIGILLVSFLGLHILTNVFGIDRMYWTKLERLHAKTCMVFVNVVVDEKCLTEKVYPKLQAAVKLAKLVDDKNLIDAKFVYSKKVQDIQGTSAVSTDSLGYGWFDNVNQVKNLYVAGGWARLVERGQPADAVLLTYEKAKGEDIIFAISDTRVERPDVVKATKNQVYLMTGWQKAFSASKLPKGLVTIKAWAFNTEKGTAFPLEGSQQIKNL